MTEKSDLTLFEKAIYDGWEQSGVFTAKPNTKADPYTIMIPPPNVTGSLHVGHALTMTIQDVLTRWRRMQGRDALWMPGTDHAGIATQMVVERMLHEEGKTTRKEMGREKFLERVWQWKAESGGSITKQLRRLGASLDWSRERFTMDEGLSKAVRESFVTLYEQGLIYRANRLVNWDPKFQSAVSDLEVENKETKGHIWYIRYPVKNSDQSITVATTRPETMLGDVAVAVHPTDERYRDLVGKMLVLPLTGREIPIITDEHSDPEKGSGAVKITPAHDFNDFAVGQRHNLTTPSVLDIEARITLQEIETELQDIPGVADKAFVQSLVGQDRFVARKLVVAELERLGFLDKVEPHTSQIPYAERGGAVIEPRMTTQWFCNAEVLAKPAIEAVQNGKMEFVPKQWENTFFAWMNNIQPWCISRQLWWGHRIPAWYGPDGHVFVARSDADAQAAAQKHYGKAVELQQDEDVLDTWFSSALWPFSTLGWPDQTPDLARYYPGDVLVTGFDIIFFWVARMMMMGLHFMGEVPFKKVYMHGLVRDEHGQKMSKSKGNVIDPLDMMDTYGTDALRWTICVLAGPGRDMKLGPTRVEHSRSFVTKLRNAATFCERNGIVAVDNFDPSQVNTPLCRWLLNELNTTMTEANNALEAFRFDDYADALYRFTWNNFCDWFIELAKPSLDGADAAEIRATGGYVLGMLLRLMHPAMPFVTEELWHKFNYGPLHSLITTAWPQPVALKDATIASAEIAWLIELISTIRSVRAEMNVPHSLTIPVFLRDASSVTLNRVQTWAHVIQSLAKIEQPQVLDGAMPANAAQAVVAETTIILPLEGLIDLDAERARLAKEQAKSQAIIDSIVKQLDNPDFVKRAPADVVTEKQTNLAAAQLEVKRLQDALERIQ